MAYDPVIPIDPKWVITHKNSVQGVEGILSSPTILESTSQVFAYGLDLFGSSVSPSGRFDVLSQEFNKLQLVATSLGLLAAVAILRPMVSLEPALPVMLDPDRAQQLTASRTTSPPLHSPSTLFVLQVKRKELKERWYPAT